MHKKITAIPFDFQVLRSLPEGTHPRSHIRIRSSVSPLGCLPKILKSFGYTLLSFSTLLSIPCARADFDSNTCEGRFSMSALMGIAPNVYADRQRANASSATPPAFETINVPPFNNQFELPFMLQGELGYFVLNDWEVFYDFDWTHAQGKSSKYSHEVENAVERNEFIDVKGTQKFSEFNGYGNYLGSRYYITFAPYSLKPFAGFKIGFMTRTAVKAKEVSTSFGKTFTDDVTYFKGTTTISGGLQLGLDWQLTQNLSCIFKAELIGTGERRSGIIFNHPPRPVLKAGNVVMQLSIPISIGIRWTL